MRAPPLPGQLRDGAAEIRARTAAAWGHRPPDLLLRGARVLLASGELLERDVGIVGRRIAVVGEDLVAPGEATVELGGKTIVPGYVEPHCHSLGPLSVGGYCGASLAHGVGCVVSDDSFVYGFFEPAQYPPMLEIARRLPSLLFWSLRLEGPRTVPLADVEALLDRPEVIQAGELMTRPVLEDLPAEVGSVLARARALGARIEAHSPGASAGTLGVAAAAGVTADHEARDGEQLRDRLRQGLWAPIRYNDMLRDAPAIVAEALAAGLSLERTALTTDWSLPPWIDRHGTVDGVIAAALAAGLPPAEAYACASRRPATYLGLDAHFGVVAPGRLACLNVLADPESPTPERVYRMGAEVARAGELLVEVPDVDWEGLGAPGWSARTRGPAAAEFEIRAGDPEMHIDTGNRTGSGPGPGAPMTCVALDPDRDTLARAIAYGFPERLEGIASTLTPRRLMAAAGADPAAVSRCVDAVMEVGGGIAFQREGELRRLPLPVGGVLTTAPIAEVIEFWGEAKALFAACGREFPDPISTLLYVCSDSLPGARFNATGLVDTRPATLLAPARPVAWR